jgi:malate dehydrogenase (oxaloacetate-decarboxylating)(NADP+)
MSEKKLLDALSYHADGRPGKIEVISTKPTQTQFDLALAYSPGVAEPCLAIAENVDDVYKYTAKGNLVAVISNGTAVLGLGDIGPEASKPVMEGKGVLFKIFADIDVFDIELNCKDVDHFVETVKAMEPTFGGINLEDIKAPESFEIEERHHFGCWIDQCLEIGREKIERCTDCGQRCRCVSHCLYQVVRFIGRKQREYRNVGF